MGKIIKVMVNGMPGMMANTVASQIINDPRFELIPYSLTGPEIRTQEFNLGQRQIKLLNPDRRVNSIAMIVKEVGPFISVDYTHPSAANSNAEFYCLNKLPFVMGTTGGDRQELDMAVNRSLIAAVLAPNMAAPIIGFQAMMDFAATNFPNMFAGYSLEIKESHQHGKADTSGTAKAMVDHFKRLGIPFTVTQIKKERDKEKQLKLGVPHEFLTGHGYHTYTLVSADKSVKLEFTHNVNGREVYAQGTLEAIVFLQKKIDDGANGRVFSMIDVLKG